jgi:hypothetical protein
MINGSRGTSQWTATLLLLGLLRPVAECIMGCVCGGLHFMPINSYKAKMLHYLKAKSNCIEQSNKQPAWETDYLA